MEVGNDAWNTYKIVIDVVVVVVSICSGPACMRGQIPRQDEEVRRIEIVVIHFNDVSGFSKMTHAQPPICAMKEDVLLFSSSTHSVQIGECS